MKSIKAILLYLLSVIGYFSGGCEPLVGQFTEILDDVNILTPPLAPNCTIPLENIISTPGIVTLYQYKRPENGVSDAIVRKKVVKTSCTSYFFGSEEKQVLATWYTPLTDADLVHPEYVRIKKSVTEEGSYTSREILSFDCRWTGTNVIENPMFEVSLTRVKYSPSGVIIYPSKITEHLEKKEIRINSNSMLLLNKATRFTLCDLEVVDISTGVIYRELASTISRVVIPYQKRTYFVEEKKTEFCGDLEIILTKGGYMISIDKTTSQRGDQTRSPLQGYEELEDMTRKRRRRDVNGSEPIHKVNPTNIMDQFPPNKRKVWEAFWDSVDSWNQYRIIQPVYLLDLFNKTNSRQKREIHHDEKSLPLVQINYQLTQSRSEMQWGLTELAKKTREDHLGIAKDLCSMQLRDYWEAWEERFTFPSRLASLTTGGFHPVAKFVDGELSVNRTRLINKVELTDPLNCISHFCQSKDGKWLESLSGFLYPRPPAESLELTRSFIAEIKPGVFLDIVTGTQVTKSNNFLYPEKLDLSLYSFNTSDLLSRLNLYDHWDQTSQRSSYDHKENHSVQVPSILGKIGAVITNFFVDTWRSILLILGLLIGIVCFINITPVLWRCCDKKERKHTNRKSEMVEMI